MNRKFYYQQRENQVSYYNNNLKGKVMNQGTFKGKPREFVLQYGLDNLYKDIKGECLKYFDEEHISWWGENKKKHLPSGHLVSSQIHCLNHLFALRKNETAVKTIIENATGLQIERVLPSPIDKDGGYITFEFICKNKTLLGEDHETRGANCTSVDATVFVETKDNEQLAVPIEWKYTETYQGKEAKKESLCRYPERILSTSHLKGWTDLYKADPYYELMRQSLLMEQIIAKPEISNIEANDYFHIVVIPQAHSELRNAINDKFVPTIKDEKKSKFIIIDPQDLLSPLKGNDDYKELIEYLETRYWK